MKSPQNFLAGVLTAGAGVLTAGAGGEMTGVCTALYTQACCKFFQQVVTSLQMTSCNKLDLNRLVAT